MNMIHGIFFLAWSKRSLTLEAPTPTNISTKSEPLSEKNGTLASPATALANRVLPVPGGPTSNTPLGTLAPISLNFLLSLKKSTISFNSSFSSSAPATSVKRTLTFCAMLALVFPKLNALLPVPPDCLNSMMKNTISSTSAIAGTISEKIVLEVDGLS